MIAAVRLIRAVMIPLAPVWGTVFSAMIATSNLAHISASAPLLVICTTTAAVPLTAALGTAVVALKVPMAAVDVR